MIIFLCGADAYRREKKLREILRDYRARHAGADLGRFDIGTSESAAPGELAAVRDFLKNRSLFDPVRAALVRLVSWTPLGKEVIAWLKDVAGDPETAVILVAESAPTAKFSFLKNLEAPSVREDFVPLSGSELRSHIMHEAAERGVHLADAECARLHLLYGSDLWAIATELDMLALTGPGRELPTAHRADFIGTIGRLAHGGISDRIISCARLLAQEDPAKTFNVLSAFVSGEKKTGHGRL
jgi:DNA polymerase III delta subunit